MKIDKTYIITYDENLPKIGRVVQELASVGIFDIEIINGVNQKTIQLMESKINGKSVSYKIDGSVVTQKLCDEFETETNSPSNCASMLSHKKAFLLAKEKGYETIMVVEDDLLLNYKTPRYLELILETVPDDRDMLRLERNLVGNTDELVWNPELINSHWFKADIVWSAARMVFNKKAINHIVTIMEDKPRPSFDRLTNMQCNQLNSYTSLRSMGIQYHL